MGRRLLAGTFVLALTVLSQPWLTPARAAPMGGMAGVGEQALVHKPVVEAGYYHRRYRSRPHFGFYAPGFSFYIGPRYRYRYYRPYYAYRPYYYASPYRYYYKPRRHYRHYRHWRRW